jgi:LysR family transcriptional regulator, nitrogen assimilation regulatory protein
VNLRQLDYFVHVAEVGSFSRAASLLSIAQSALSHKVRQLEIELKQPLLYRNGRGVTPTDAGKRLLEHARGILLQVSRTRDELEDLRGTPTGHVVVGLPQTVAMLIAVPLVGQFRAAFPKASLGIREGLSVSLVEWLSTGRADIGLLFNPAPSIDIMPWLEEPMCLVARREAHARGGGRNSIGLAELARVPLILASRPNAHRMLIDTELGNLGLRPTIALEVDGVGSILKLVAEGCGQTVLPRTSLRGFGLDRAFSVRPIVRPSIAIRLALAVSAQRPITPLVQGVLSVIRGIGPALLSGRR